MIISYRNKFVLIHPCKTGSSSAEAMLHESGLLGESDIYTEVRDSVDKAAIYDTNIKGISCNAIRKISPYTIPDTAVDDNGDGYPLLSHATPTELYRLGLIDEDILENYQFLILVRHPVEQFLSWFFFHSALKKAETSLYRLNRAINVHPCNRFLGRKTDDYFSCEDRQLNNTLVISNINTQLKAFIQSKGGGCRANKAYKKQYRPDWGHVNKLPEYLVDKLTTKLEPDIRFYLAINGE